MSATPRPSGGPPPFDSEKSEVRSATHPRLDSKAPRSSERPSSEDAVARGARMQHKMTLAVSALRDLSPHDPMSRLIKAAILRRDEALLDGVLRELGAKPPTVPPKSA